MYAVAHWKTLYFVRVKKDDAAGAMASVLYPQEFVKVYAGPSTAASAYFEQQRTRVLEAGGPELMFAVYEILRFAARADREGGRLVDHLGLPASLNAIAAGCALPFHRVQTILHLLSSSRIEFLTRTPWGPSMTTDGPVEPAGSSGKPCVEAAGLADGNGERAITGDGQGLGAGDRDSRQVAGAFGGGAGPPSPAGPVAGPTVRGVAQQQPRGGSQEQEQEQGKGKDKGEGLAASCKLQSEAAEKSYSAAREAETHAGTHAGRTMGQASEQSADGGAIAGGQTPTQQQTQQGQQQQPQQRQQPPNGTSTGAAGISHAKAPTAISPAPMPADGPGTAGMGIVAAGCEGVECPERQPDVELWRPAIADGQWSVAWPQVLGDPKGDAFGRLMWRAIGWEKRDGSTRERHRQMGVFVHAWHAAAGCLPAEALLDLAEAAVRKARSIADQDRRKRQGIGVPWTDGPQQVWRTWWDRHVSRLIAQWAEAVRVLPPGAP